ncbi:MAG: DUF4835 family protein [Muribaculaceae bacterium]|nr:DUF4835 family protein [Muribaculaceae bacterium]MCI9053599.1 DUF4835 family protein [Muribaculaceae bacterium]
MKTYGRIISSLLLLLAAPIAKGQELNCTVEFNTDQVSGTNKSVFETLREAVSDYMNTTVFTPAQFSTNEKIDCRLFFTIKEQSDDGVIKGDLQIQSSRPVYNSSYTTTLINFKDSKIDFTYQEGEPLNFTVNSMENQLTAILNFYAYLILAFDFDSFAPNGGEPYWERLKQIVQMAQSSGETGWKAFEDTKNRSAVLTAFTEGRGGEALRKMIYDYHRLGLDQMALSVDKGRASVTESLDAINTVYSLQPMSVALSMFKDAKLDELVNVYSKAPAEERTKVYNLLQPIYPTDEQQLVKIKNGQEK